MTPYERVRRTTANQTTTTGSNSTGSYTSYWVRIVRSGTTVTTYRSSDGNSWSSCESISMLGNQCAYGWQGMRDMLATRQPLREATGLLAGFPKPGELEENIASLRRALTLAHA